MHYTNNGGGSIVCAFLLKILVGVVSQILSGYYKARLVFLIIVVCKRNCLDDNIAPMGLMHEYLIHLLPYYRCAAAWDKFRRNIIMVERCFVFKNQPHRGDIIPIGSKTLCTACPDLSGSASL